MPYLRCEACGAKALPIATRCPACEAPFEVSRTVERRLRACPSCDSLVPRSDASCRWCGAATTRRAPPAVWAGAAATLLMVVGSWALFANRPDDVVLITGPAPDVTLPATSAAPPTPRAAAERRDARRSDPPVTAGPSASDTPDVFVSLDTGREAAGPASGTADVASPEAADPGEIQPDDESLRAGWVRAVARTFVNVRSAPASDGEVRGVVAENAVVFLGDARGAWRQVRSGDVAGWAWEPLFTLTSGGT
jgi:hypothetical protein